MQNIKKQLDVLLEQNVCVSVNNNVLDSKQALSNSELNDETQYMLDYIWDDNDCFLRLDVKTIKKT